MTTGLVIAAALVLFVSMAYVIVRLIEQRDHAAAGWADELFVAAGLRHKAKLLTAVNVRLVEDFEAVTERLAEVLRDHAECPVPVAPRPDVIDDAWLELLVTRPEGDGS